MNITNGMDNKLLKLAEFYDSDKEDMQECKADLAERFKLDDDTSTKVASALRNKYLKQAAEKHGLSEEDLSIFND
jgi:hypothetical protein